MTRIQELEKHVQQLTRDELWTFDQWYQEFVADLWDEEIEQDMKAGRLDKLAEQALRDAEAGRCTDL